MAASVGFLLIPTPIPLASSQETTAGGGAAGSEIVIPAMNAANGRILFASKGCVVCHAVNGIGGKDARPLDAATMPKQMNPFDFAAGMWRSAMIMAPLQRKELGEQTQLTGQELADIIAFVHSADEQRKFSEDNIPPEIKQLMKE
ncbi:MAG: c-type cytochrome [Rhizobiales bacterium]|nr:c-type cytochrome [Hyphomicrobiales bacterium]MBI3672067.1 c-type cytochrome [Hyphomicrobiales bacterium]